MTKTINKNDEFELKIDSMGTDGEGVAHIEGYALFIKDAMPGDVVRIKIIKAKKNYGYGRLMEIIKPSKDRVEPVCKVARQCGGCQIQHVSYQAQLEYKKNKIANCLIRLGKFPEEQIEAIMEPVMGMEEPYHYRNKAQFPVGRNKDGELVTGFYASRTHSIIPVTNCAIQDKQNEEILKQVLGFMKENAIEPYDETKHSGLIRHILTRVGYYTGEIMVCLVINGTSLPYQEKLIEKLTGINGMKSISININKEKTNVILGDKVKVIWGEGYIVDFIGTIKYQISPLSFYQVNPLQTQKLYQTALEYAALTGNEIVWDLYCGIGTISLFLAQQAKMVYGVEIVPEAIADANRNKEFNGIENAEFFAGASEIVLSEKYKESNGKMSADVIVIDPPRKGCDGVLLETIIDIAPEKVVYVSCDPATLARDLRVLCDNGYELKRVRGCDMFGHSGHVETVVKLERIRKE
ncbi:23S rRNA (uracil(1939)-C(5))-methyltransferase RlmD [[Clostridium] polysaccharolyticum]|uniref:23S rRNA m(5)U-1939 methyltransferase n=1 Tax=[Clostridium] polysaccharolyticum TaxID=29364 RepID=A0A1I0E7L3_9FIRM|nr:23S rRNA (uracil(1939)-C(5))-methyltransferase RlmD [[Clostridium] polysaccharolyticum]SET41213.1 23S rRNA m(5)U-1939 methyltransferase [[Clostridium] polysaccharolyticum]